MMHHLVAVQFQFS